MSIRIGIFGYGNLGRGVECALRQNPDMELKAVFTRRDPARVSILTEGVPVLKADEAERMKDEIDVLILCGGSATDLPDPSPRRSQPPSRSFLPPRPRPQSAPESLHGCQSCPPH